MTKKAIWIYEDDKATLEHMRIDRKSKSMADLIHSLIPAKPPLE